MTKIKICGLALYEDADFASSLGADYLGMVFYQKSKRLCPLKEAIKIMKNISLSKKVLVFGYDDYSYMKKIFSYFSLNGFTNKGCQGQSSDDILVQVPYDHNSLTEIEKRVGPLRMIVSVPVQNTIKAQDILPLNRFYALILDTGGQKDASGGLMPGGTGVSFNWDYAKNLQNKYFLAGGLTPHNVEDALRVLHPYAVDASSGLEKTPGVKDHEKIRLFVERVRKSR